MSVRICTYNTEWFDDLFDSNNEFKTFSKPSEQKKAKEKLDGLKTVFKTVNADLFGVIEAPNTTTTSGAQSTIAKLNKFLLYAGIVGYQPMTGFISAGRQEIAVVFNKQTLDVKHKPGGSSTKKNPRFDDIFEFDTDDDEIKEIYKFYRPPLEAEVTVKATNESFNILVAHTKSKGIFTSMDMVKWDQENTRNRHKLFAECSWIRRRVDEWLTKNKKVVVMGDINDGPGMDYYELKFGRSAVEIIMGDLFNPDIILRNYAGKPKWGNYGWEPSSTSFTDRFTGTPVNALIDHIMLSANITVVPDSFKIWNPYSLDEAKPIKNELKAASDHYPVSIDIF